MELIRNPRIKSRYSESIRSKALSRYSRTPIELGKRITSPKKRKKSPIKVIKIKNNIKKHDYLTQHKQPYIYKNKSDNLDRNINKQYVPNNTNKQKETHNISKSNKNRYSNLRDNITYNKHPPKQLINAKKNVLKKDFIKRKSYDRNQINNFSKSPVKKKSEFKYKTHQAPLKKNKKVFLKKRLYIKSDKNISNEKTNNINSGGKEPSKKYFNPNNFVKNKNKSEFFNKMSSEDIYICSVLSQDLNIIRSK